MHLSDKDLKPKVTKKGKFKKSFENLLFLNQ